MLIGGEMTAAHLACDLSQKESIHSVTMIRRHSLCILARKLVTGLIISNLV